MKKLIVFIAVIFFGLILGGNVQTAIGQTRFSSVYTKNIDKCGSGWTRKEEKEAENRGQDIPISCKGPGGYKLEIGYSCCTSEIAAALGEKFIPVLSTALGWNQKAVEWRLAGGKPFAIIIRYNTYKFDEEKQLFSSEVTGERLKIKGLFGFEQIDGEVDARQTKDPNVEARRIADAGFSK